MGKITTAVFEPGSTTANVYGLWQWGYGQILRIQGLHLPSMVEIHFSLQETGGVAPMRVGVTKDGVTDVIIPDSMLENDGATRNYNMFAFIYLTDDTSGQTEYKIKLHVKSRPKPEVPGGGEDPDIFHDAVQRVKESADKAAESERQAEGWAHGREDLPERAQDNAKYYAGQAAADAKKTGTDRKEVERLVESVSGIDEQVIKVENLTKQAQTSATNAALSEQASKTAETNAQNAQAGAEIAEGNAELAERNAKASEQAVEKAKQLVTQMGQEVLDNKNHVDQTAQAFTLTAQQAVADINNAGQTQTERVEGAGNTAVESVKTAQNTATKAVEIAKTEAVKSVQTEGTTQTGNVTAEGTKQVQAVQQAAQEIVADREQIAQNKADVTALKEDLNELAHDISVLKAQKTGKLYGVKKWKSLVNPTSACEKTRDNAGLVCEPSTDKEQGRDDYADIPLFQWRRCNYRRYDDGFAYPIAFEGDSDYNDKDNADVGNIYQTFYYNEIDMGDYTELIISDSPNYQLGLRPWEEAVRADGTIMPYFIYSAYSASIGNDGNPYSLPNKREEGFFSYNTMIDKFQKKGKGYWGASVRRNTFGMIFSQIKYATKDIQSVMSGCTNYNFQYEASVQSETKNTYFPITKAQANNIAVGAYVSIGYGQAKPDKSVNLDRGVKTIGAYGDMVKVLRIEDLDETNSAVYVECEPFNTMPVQDKTETDVMCEIVMSSMPWWTGSTDKVLGHHDGAAVLRNGKYPYRIQGIEYQTGRYQIASDVAMMFRPDYSKDVYLAERGIVHSKSDSVIKETYTKIGNIPASANGKGSDYWIGDVTIKKGVWFPSAELDQALGYADRLYSGGTQTSGAREYLQGGPLWFGSNAGLAFLNCWYGLGWANWDCAAAD